MLLEGSVVGAERGTLPGSAGLMEQGWFNQSGGLMLGCKWSEEWGEDSRRKRSLC